MTEDEMVGCHHRLNGHEFEQAVGDGEGQGSLACCRPWGREKSDTTEKLNVNDNWPKGAASPGLAAPLHSPAQCLVELEVK